MSAFSAPIDDIVFALRDVAGADQFEDWDDELAREVLAAFGAFAKGELAPLNGPGDVQGCRLENGRVFMPDGFAEAYSELAGSGWQGMVIAEEFGGQGMPAYLQSAVSEIFSGANHSLQMVVNLCPGAAKVLTRFGSEELQQRYLPRLASGETLATMCLTEPDAGSDLARVRCRAVPAGDGWSLSGEKIFISGGDQNLSPESLHLVLARTSDDGLRGLSLFACSSLDASGDRNRVSVERIEHKMGLHASPTCQLRFDGAQASIIGNPGQGLACMFAMMNHARIDVALQGVAHAARAYNVARNYARERIQGVDAERKPVSIDQHADVARMLNEMAAGTFGGRAMAYRVLLLLESEASPALLDFLTPVVKVFCSELGVRVAELGQQVLGGYGYLSEYSLEQVYRDARITSIYEGANGIHSRGLLKRELARKHGAEEFREMLLAGAAMSEHGDLLRTSIDHWQTACEELAAQGFPEARAADFMSLTAKLLYLSQWLRILRMLPAAPNASAYRSAGAHVLNRVPQEISFLSGLLTQNDVCLAS